MEAHGKGVAVFATGPARISKKGSLYLDDFVVVYWDAKEVTFIWPSAIDHAMVSTPPIVGGLPSLEKLSGRVSRVCTAWKSHPPTVGF